LNDDLALRVFEESSHRGLKPKSPRRERPTQVVSVVRLPEPKTSGGMPIWEATARRRSERRLTDAALSIEHLSQLAWATSGISERKRSLRTSPSAGAVFPYEAYVIAAVVEGLTPGIYRYEPLEHALQLLFEGDFREELVDACLGQRWALPCPATFVWTAIPKRCSSRYGSRAARYINLDLGYVAENFYLASVSLGLGTCSIGAFSDDLMNALMGLDGEQELVVLAHPVGHRAT
jgi:SagB-type dehydrogenase family enzyme